MATELSKITSHWQLLGQVAEQEERRLRVRLKETKIRLVDCEPDIRLIRDPRYHKKGVVEG